MKQYSRIGSLHKYEIRAQLSKDILTINLADFQPADFCKPGLQDTFKKIECPQLAATILSMESCKQWNVVHSDPSTLNRMIVHLNTEGYPELASFIGEWVNGKLKEESLPNLWLNELHEMITQEAIRCGFLATPLQKSAVLHTIKKTNPRFHKSSRHRIADHFLNHEWAAVYSWAKSMV